MDGFLLHLFLHLFQVFRICIASSVWQVRCSNNGVCQSGGYWKTVTLHAGNHPHRAAALQGPQMSKDERKTGLRDRLQGTPGHRESDHSSCGNPEAADPTWMRVQRREPVQLNTVGAGDRLWGLGGCGNQWRGTSLLGGAGPHPFKQFMFPSQETS